MNTRERLIEVHASAPWRAFRDPKTNMWIGICDELKLTARGEDLNDLRVDISDILETLLTEIVSP